MNNDMDKDVAHIPYYVAEGIMDRQSLTISRLWILCITLILLLVGTNAMWIWYESQFEYYEQSVEQEIDTGNREVTVIGIGDNYGEDKADHNR